MKIKIGILGATGYTGAELLRLLVNHGGVEISWLTSEKFSGKTISQVFPHLSGFLDIECKSVRKLGELQNVDLVFSCLPHVTSMHFVKKMLDTGARVIDFSSDFRFSDIKIYEKWFKSKHKYRNYLKNAVYGLAEINKEAIINAQLVANPGCYATSVILGTAPMVKEGLLMPDSIVADIKSGLSGAGRAPDLEHHFSEANESINIDSVSGHNQKPEMEQELSKLGNSNIHITFIPHQASFDRGILATIYSSLNKRVTANKIHDIYAKFYSNSCFVRISELGNLPGTKNVRYSNMCDIGIGFQDDIFVSVAAIDNLGKGASGQAIQNMNLMFDFPETQGLTSTAIYP
ncbi:MAG: N-acetyl-gamma-glutamyl-phosphate reductase [Thermodesulfobacteriota bacterium]|nr:MAG: N-acetyl-gamma-glutamyl-phosphate reductase [Thermodesulfobacteriota bacterium]